MSDQRKATDILLSIEDKIVSLDKLMRSYDLNIKFILDRMNKVYNYIQRLEQLEDEMRKAEGIQLPVTNFQNQEIPQQQGQDQRIFNSIKPEMEMATTINGQRRTPRMVPNQPVVPQKQVPAVQGQAAAMPQEILGGNGINEDIKRKVAELRKQQEAQAAKNTNAAETSQQEPITQNPDRKVPIVQKVVDEFGKDLYIADISIYNSNKELVTKTKTNMAGKYQAQLIPGKYTVEISKVNTKTRSKAKGSQEIIVTNSKAPITLPNATTKSV